MISVPVGQSRHADVRPALRVHNPRTEALLEQLRDAVAGLRSAIDEGEIDNADALGVAAQVYEIGEQVSGLHLAAVQVADRSGLWGIAGYTSTNAWLRHTHLLDGRGASRVSRTARWLANQAAVARALADGEITEAHVQRMRVVVTQSPVRAAAFRDVAEDFVTIARNADPEYLGRVLRSWGDTVDEQASDDSSRRSYEKRGLFLSPVADGWDVKGWLSEADGAELAGLLNEQMSLARRDDRDSTLSAAQRRADALLDLARMAAAGGFIPAQRDRAKLLVLVPAERLIDCPTCRVRLGAQHVDAAKRRAADHESQSAGCEQGAHGVGESGKGWSMEQRGGEPPDEAAGQWRVSNGTGRGQLSISEVRRLSCDAGIQRVVLSPQSTVLDVGRAQRLVTAAIRTALEVRDGGCVVPGCDRPPGWCEAHHLKHWAKGGDTSLQNLILACSRHHHEIHQGKWRVRIDDRGEVRVSQRTRRPTPLGGDG